ncbi:MAG TPA: ABC transporter permease [Ramlibacter sp.]|nr:ABC transporter permease [Ramlibacter sp.]
MDATPNSLGQSARLNLHRALLIGCFLLVWEACARTQVIDPVFFGSPSGMSVWLYQELSRGTLLKELGWTLAGAFSAFLIGSVLAVATGLLFLASPYLERLLDPILSALNSMPRIALAPLFLIWFGLGLASKIAMGASLTYFIVLSSTVAGCRAVSSDHMLLATTLNATATQRFFRFVLPNAVPTMFSGLRLGLIYSLLGVVGCEIIASEHGLGQMVSLLAAGFKTNGVLAVLITLAIVGVIFTTAMTRLENWLLRWR